jgi:hypothetical protein
LLLIEPPMVPRLRTAGSPISSASAARAGIACLTTAVGDVGVPAHGADGKPAALFLDPLELGDAAEVDQVARLGEALLEGGQVGLAAGQQLRVLVRGEQGRRVRDTGGPMIVEFVHERRP